MPGNTRDCGEMVEDEDCREVDVDQVPVLNRIPKDSIRKGQVPGLKQLLLEVTEDHPEIAEPQVPQLSHTTEDTSDHGEIGDDEVSESDSNDPSYCPESSSNESETSSREVILNTESEESDIDISIKKFKKNSEPPVGSSIGPITLQGPSEIRDELNELDEIEDDDLCEKEHDVSRKGIYIAKVSKSSTSRLGRKKKCDRVYNSTSVCPFCHKIQTNVSHHIMSKVHMKMPEVQELMKCSGKERKIKLELLRLRGNHKNNLKILEKGKGQIRLTRRGTQKLDIEEYGPCPSCFGWMLKQNIKRHGIKCPANFDKTLSSTSLQVQSDVIVGRVPVEATTALVNEVFSIMQNDEVTEVAKSDKFIVNLGNRLLKRNIGNKVMRKYYTSSPMRLCANLLIQLRELYGENMTFEEFLKPRYYKHFVEASLICAKQSAVDEEDLASPSNCVKLGYDLKRLASAKLAFAISNGDLGKKTEAKEFLTLMKLNWHTDVTKLARELLISRNMNRDKSLPLPSDIKKLTEFLKTSLQGFDVKELTYANFRHASELALSRLTLYNRRRSHEVQAITLREYQNRKKGVNEIAVEMMRDLTEWERKLLTSQEVLEIRGKKSRIVPAIIPADVIRILQFLSDSSVRANCGILQSNPYIFGNNGAGVIRCYDAIRKMPKAAGLMLPNLVKSTNMRKYMATMVQCLDTTESERNWIVRHLGHNMNTHLTHYQQTSDLIERVDVAKLLLIQDENRVKDFFGKRIEDVQFEDILTVSNQDIEDLDVTENNEDVIPVPDVYGFWEEEEEERAPKRKSTQTQRQKWTAEEEMELRRLFSRNFLNLKCPNSKEIKIAEKRA